MRCKLCELDRPLQRSHIIPEFLYKSMYDDLHRFHVISAAVDQPDSMEQKGLREPLLCGECETKLSRWESYAHDVLTGGIELHYRKKGRSVIVDGFDYAKMKLFQLSILWRAGVSSLQLFSHVDLGAHEPKLRQMLADETPGDAAAYGCVIFGLIDDEGKTATNLIVQPERIKMGAHVGYRFIFGGFAWYFVVSSRKPTEDFSVGFLTREGRLVFTIKNIFDTALIREFGERRFQLGRSVHDKQN